MLEYIARRLLLLIPTIVLISIISFVVIQLPPGDFLTSYIMTLESQGQLVDQALIDQLSEQYGLNQPIYVQYGKWVVGMLHGNFGQSLTWGVPVKDLIWERIGLTFAISFASLLFIWVVAFPVGIYSAIKQYSVGDYLFTFISFVGLGIPPFLLALVVMWLAFSKFGISVGGLFSSQYSDAPWSWGKFVDLINHIWIPMVVLGMGGTAGLIRILRPTCSTSCTSPTCHQPGQGHGRDHADLRVPRAGRAQPVRQYDWLDPSGLVSGSVIVSVVLNLPTTGPILLRALNSQDMYLAGAIVLMFSVLTVIGTLISDILLAWLDPRIRLEGD